MNLRKTEVFMADVERQFDWYRDKEAWDVAERYLRSVEASCTFLERHPFIRFAVSRLGFRDGVSFSFFVRSMSTFCSTR
jgi:hypothetical protein